MAPYEADDDVTVENEGNARPYRASWINILARWIDARQHSYWAYYFGCGTAVLVILFSALWLEGATISGSVGAAQAYLVGVMAYMFALMHFLDRRAATSLEAMRSALTTDGRAFRTLAYRLTTLPALPTLLASLLVLAFVLFTEAVGEVYNLDELADAPISALLLRIVYLVCWMVFGTFLYHTYHQLRLFNQVYTKYTEVNLFRVKPLYAFSNLAALTAGSLAMISYGWLVVNPGIDQSDPRVFLPIVILLLFAAFVFVTPQIGIHRLQVMEKDRLLDEATQRLESTIAELHQQIDDHKLEGIGQLNTAMTTLQTEINILKKTPTWPWEPEVVRLLITALALPLGVWLVQFILQRIVSQ